MSMFSAPAGAAVTGRRPAGAAALCVAGFPVRCRPTVGGPTHGRGEAPEGCEAENHRPDKHRLSGARDGAT